jgi:hypothetical protein
MCGQAPSPHFPQPQGFRLVGCAQAFLFAGGVVFDVKAAIAAAPIQSEFLRHNFFTL